MKPVIVALLLITGACLALSGIIVGTLRLTGFLPPALENSVLFFATGVALFVAGLWAEGVE